MHEPMQIDKFVTELQQKGKNCEFGMSEDDMIRDKIVFSVTDKSVTEKLLREPNLTLQKAIDICRASEIAKERINIMASAKKESEEHAFDVTKGAKYKNKPFKATPSHNKKVPDVDRHVHQDRVQHMGLNAKRVAKPTILQKCAG